MALLSFCLFHPRHNPTFCLPTISPRRNLGDLATYWLHLRIRGCKYSHLLSTFCRKSSLSELLRKKTTGRRTASKDFFRYERSERGTGFACGQN